MPLFVFSLTRIALRANLNEYSVHFADITFMTSNSRSTIAEQKVQMIVERLQRVVDHLKACGPQPWEILVAELNEGRTSHIHTALKELQQWKRIKMRGWMVCLTGEVSSLNSTI
jgi:hypothetical protein